LSRRQRILVVMVGVLVVLLYLVALACQARAGTGDRDTGHDGVLDWLGERFGWYADADPADVSADCDGEQPGRVVFDGRCTLVVAPSEDALRLVPLRSRHAIEVSAPAPAGDFTMDSEVEPGDTIRVAVGGDGAEIELRCVDDDDCVVEWGAGDDR